ncbi:DUF2946 family protein [Xanthobacter agilis]|uniref:DUF2946 domain-containing protein n=1 Tax=Xanthobacter agilis TaxID=47492 RepID=A0ABU0L908_XANAG|nr:DUF2946 family protein [Xanthobacter agilis]MDQ0503632.1 hypothetical protein [Xanthobacter agilis]
MRGRHSRLKALQHTVAWAAAYALVLQVMLMTALGASLVGGASSLSMPLCVNGATSGNDDDGPQKAAAHCPLCLSRVDAVVLPPPVETPHMDRIAIELRYRVILRDGLRVAEHRRPSQPRAPPAFA